MLSNMLNLVPILEGLLFASASPVTVKQLAKWANVSEAEVLAALEEMATLRNTEASGIHVLRSDDKVQLVTSPLVSEAVRVLSKEDLSEELTRPSLEALTIIAYRGPVTKPEIEAVRGVNCSLIIRNLLMRGLIEEKEDGHRLQPVYTLSTDALRHLGVRGVEELPDYGELHGNAHIDALLAAVMTEGEGAPAATEAGKSV